MGTAQDSHLLLENMCFSQHSDYSNNKRLFSENTFNLNTTKIETIVSVTVSQASKIQYHQLRKFRITASNFNFLLISIQRNRYPKLHQWH